MRKPGRKESQGVPPCTPEHKTARWGSLHLLGWWPLERSLSSKSAPDQIWIRIFGEKSFAGHCSVKNPAIKNLPKESPQIRARTWVAIKPTAVPLRLYPQNRASEQRAALKPGVQGRSPWCSFLHFSQEKWRPPAGTPPGRCAPRPVRAPTACRVHTTGGSGLRPRLAGFQFLPVYNIRYPLTPRRGRRVPGPPRLSGGG